MKTIGVMVIQRDDGKFVPVEFGHQDGERAVLVRSRDAARVLTRSSSTEDDLAFADLVQASPGYSTALELHKQFPGVAVGVPGGVPDNGYRALLGAPRG